MSTVSAKQLRLWCLCWFLLILLEHQSPLCYVTSNRVFLHSWRSLAIACFIFIPIIFKSFSTSYLHLLHGLPFSLVSFIVDNVICCGVVWFCILSAWPCHLSRRDFINFTNLYLVFALYHLVCSYSSAFSFFYRSMYYLLFWVWSFIPWALSTFLTHRSVWVILQFYLVLI